MNIWSQAISQTIAKYLQTQRLQLDVSTLNSNTLVYSSPYLYILIKTIKKDKAALKLLVVDISQITRGSQAATSDIKCIDITLHQDNREQSISNKESRIQIQINPIDPSYWLLTIQTPSKNCPRTRVFLSKYVQKDKEDIPLYLAFHYVNTSSQDISKVKFHPQSAEYFVVLFRSQKIDFINYVENMNYPELELDLSLQTTAEQGTLEFVDIEFGTSLQDIFDIYVLSKQGAIFYLPKILLNNIELSYSRSASLKMNKSWGWVKDYAKIGEDRVLISYDQEHYFKDFKPIIFERSNKKRQSDHELTEYYQFKYFSGVGAKSFVLLERGTEDSKTVFSSEFVVVPAKRSQGDTTFYSIEKTYFKHPYNHAFLGKTFQYPRFIISEQSDEKIYVMHLNVLYQLQLSNVFKFLNQSNPLKQQSILSNHSPLITHNVLVSSKSLEGRIEAKSCGFYGLLFVENILLLSQSTGDKGIRLNGFPIDSRLNNIQIQFLKKEFMKLVEGISKPTNEILPDNPTQIKKLDLSPELNSLLENYDTQLNSIKKQIKNKEMNICVLRGEHKKKFELRNKNNAKRIELDDRLYNIQSKLDGLLNSNKEQEEIQRDPKIQMFEENIQQMSHEFEVGKTITLNTLAELGNIIDDNIKEVGPSIQQNWNQLVPLVQRVRKISNTSP